MREDWQTVKLGDVLKTSSGGTPTRSRKEYYEGGKIPWLMSGEVAQGNVYEAKNFITEEGLKNSSAKMFPPETVLVAMYGATAGQVGILRVESTTNQAVCGIFPSQEYVPEFLYYSILQQQKDLIKAATGNAQPNISQTKIKDIQIPLPPLPEQERIVSILDKAFEGIDKAIAQTEQNLASARELFESYLNNIFTQKGDDWVEKKLVDVCSKIGSGATPKGGAESYKTEGISLIRSLNVYDWRFTIKKLAYIDDDQAAKLKNVIVEEADVLFNITGASVARCCVVPDELLPARVNQHVSILRPKQDELSSGFLCYLLTSRPYKEILLGIGDEGGSTRQAITKKQLQDLVVSFPDLLTQQTTVASLLEAHSKSKSLQALYTQKLNDLKELKQSLLQQAFAGELTKEDAA